MTQQQLLDNFNLNAADLITYMEKYPSSAQTIFNHIEFNYQEATKALNKAEAA